MPVESNDFYEVAKDSYRLSTEIGYRNCVSRAYYSMYHCALEIVTCEIPKYEKHSVHGCLLTYLKEGASEEPYNPTKLRILSYILRQHRENRNKADYELDTDKVNQLMADAAISAAAKVASMCDELKKAA